MDKLILDATCGSRMIWFDKENPLALYADCREVDNETIWTSKDGKTTRTLTVKPDVVCDFTALPFKNEQFYMVVFDPPHVQSFGETSWMFKKYGRLPENWKPLIHDGFNECMRVLKPYLLPPIRFLLGWGKRKKSKYYFNHQYDDFDSWYINRCEQEKRFREAFSKYLSAMGYGIVYKYKDGTVVPVNGEYKVLDEYRDIYRLVDDCRDIFIPVKFEPLKSRWKGIIKDTWIKFLLVFKPYFIK